MEMEIELPENEFYKTLYQIQNPIKTQKSKLNRENISQPSNPVNPFKMNRENISKPSNPVNPFNPFKMNRENISKPSNPVNPFNPFKTNKESISQPSNPVNPFKTNRENIESLKESYTGDLEYNNILQIQKFKKEFQNEKSKFEISKMEFQNEKSKFEISKREFQNEKSKFEISKREFQNEKSKFEISKREFQNEKSNIEKNLEKKESFIKELFENYNNNNFDEYYKNTFKLIDISLRQSEILLNNNLNEAIKCIENLKSEINNLELFKNHMSHSNFKIITKYNEKQELIKTLKSIQEINNEGVKILNLDNHIKIIKLKTQLRKIIDNHPPNNGQNVNMDILTKIINPEENDKLLISNLRSMKKFIIKLQNAQHPDKNFTNDQNWQILTESISKILNQIQSSIQ